MSLIDDRGVVLRTYRLGEADRIVVALSEGHGKVRAVAKGVRRTASRFGARVEPLSHVHLLLWHGRGDLDTINQAETIESHQTIRHDLQRVAMGLSMLEVTDQLAQERHSDPRLYGALVGALRVLDDPATDPTLVVPAFFLKALVIEGAAPILFECASCGADGKETELVAFDFSEGGTLCRQCRRGRPISPDALGIMRLILGGGLAGLLRQPAPDGASEVAQLATEAVETHLDRRLRSVRSTVGL